LMNPLEKTKIQARKVMQTTEYLLIRSFFLTAILSSWYKIVALGLPRTISGNV
jgi:hypothetical protein